MNLSKLFRKTKSFYIAKLNIMNDLSDSKANSLPKRQLFCYSGTSDSNASFDLVVLINCSIKEILFSHLSHKFTEHTNKLIKY